MLITRIVKLKGIGPEGPKPLLFLSFKQALENPDNNRHTDDHVSEYNYERSPTYTQDEYRADN